MPETRGRTLKPRSSEQSVKSASPAAGTGGPAKKPPSPEPTDQVPASSPPYRPRLSEFLALLHHETQQVIEYLAQPELHQVLETTPSASFIKIERIEVEVPVRLLVELADAATTEADLALMKEGKVPLYDRKFLLRDGTSLLMRASILEPRAAETTGAEARMRVEFSIAAK